MLRRDRVTVGVLATLGVCACTLHLYGTRQGIGLNADALIHLEAASNLVKGNGLVHGPAARPLTHFPPLYPTILAFVGVMLSVELQQAARLLNAVLWGANTFLVGSIIYRLSCQSMWLAVLGAALTLSSPALLQVHSAALSEPLFILTAFLGLYMLTLYATRRPPRLLQIAALITSLALLTRYIGGVLVFTGSLWLLAARGRSFGRRLADGLQFGLIASLPLAAYTLYTSRITGSIANRSLLWHPITMGHVRQALGTLSVYALPAATPSFTRGLAVLGMMAALGLCIAMLREHAPSEGNLLSRSACRRDLMLFGSFAIWYMLGLLVSISTFDANTPLSSRILIPILVAFLVFALGGVGLLTHAHNRTVRILGLLPFMVLTALYATAYWPRVQDMHLNGQRYSGARYESSALVQAIRELSANTPLLTNNSTVLYLMTGHESSQLPWKYKPTTLEPNANYRKWVERAVEQLRRQGGLIVYLTVDPTPRWQVKLSELREIASMEVILSTDEGVLLRPLPPDAGRAGSETPVRSLP